MRAPALGTVAVLALLALMACGGGDEPRTGGVAQPSETASGSASGSTSADPANAPEGAGSSEESTPEAPLVPAPQGPTITTEDGVSVTVPEGFDGGGGGGPDSVVISVRASDRSRITLSSTPIIGEPDFETFQRIALQTARSTVDVEVQPERELLGEPAYHFSGRFDQFQRVDELGVELPDAGIAVTLTLRTLATYSRAQREEIVEPVLASLEVG